MIEFLTSAWFFFGAAGCHLLYELKLKHLGRGPDPNSVWAVCLGPFAFVMAIVVAVLLALEVEL